ncbi:hypothetical protein [Flavobacterium psychrotolerans]|uniref:Lipoprotein n=1 Tax=Flavobacterium psychrotolerans TaxID=2169410 RepID=A0A2U1JN18_9FLAO|nr:hypothetical protein [Flavobacterium psychrotolerans]PWA06561.1 hypothetical protein DB895_03865 [Flavobacterium psychrotolerans]
MKFNCSRILFLFLSLVCFSTSLTFVSCNDNAEKRDAENMKDAKKKEIIFENINKGWNFSNPRLVPASQSIVNKWNEWRQFVEELNLKPKSSIGAFQKKAKTLSKKVSDLNNTIPAPFNKPEIKSRISVLTTKINAINLFINLDDIPDQKVVTLVSEINQEMLSLTQQMDEIIRKNAIPKEEGESDMIRMLDTSRAIPSVKKDKILP